MNSLDPDYISMPGSGRRSLRCIQGYRVNYYGLRCREFPGRSNATGGSLYEVSIAIFQTPGVQRIEPVERSAFA